MSPSIAHERGLRRVHRGVSICGTASEQESGRELFEDYWAITVSHIPRHCLFQTEPSCGVMFSWCGIAVSKPPLKEGVGSGSWTPCRARMREQKRFGKDPPQQARTRCCPPFTEGRTMETRIATTADGIMSRPVVTVPPRLDVAAVAALLHEHRISGVPVVDPDGHVLGLVSEYDLLAKTGTTAEEIMTTAVISVSADTAIADVRHLLVSQRIGRLPVLTGGRLAGIISRGDLVALLATEWVCGVCGEPARGENPPASCLKCGGASTGFTLQEQPPGP